MRRLAWIPVVLALACDRGPQPVSPGLDPNGEPGADPGAPAGGAGPDTSAAAEPSPPSAATPTNGDRTAMVAASHPLYARLEGDGFANDCQLDDACRKGGCSGEVCSAQEGVNTTCEVLSVQFPADAACGCVQGQCRWFSPSGQALSGTAPASTAVPATGQGTAPDSALVVCGAKTCKPGQSCVEYYGVAGDKGPKLQSCEWRCGDGCPAGTTCTTVADGPGKVCR